MISSPLYILGGVAYEAVPCRVHGVVLRKAARRKPSPGQMSFFDAPQAPTKSPKAPGTGGRKKMQEGATRMKNGRQQVLKNSRWRNVEPKGKATPRPGLAVVQDEPATKPKTPKAKASAIAGDGGATIATKDKELKDAFVSGQRGGKNPGVLTSPVSDAFVLGQFLADNGISGEAKKGRGSSWSVGSQTFKVNGDEVIEVGADSAPAKSKPESTLRPKSKPKQNEMTDPPKPSKPRKTKRSELGFKVPSGQGAIRMTLQQSEWRAKVQNNLRRYMADSSGHSPKERVSNIARMRDLINAIGSSAFKDWDIQQSDDGFIAVIPYNPHTGEEPGHGQKMIYHMDGSKAGIVESIETGNDPEPTLGDMPEKSDGHIGFDHETGHEYIRTRSGDVSRASISDPIMPDGRRFARFESTAAGWASHPVKKKMDGETEPTLGDMLSEQKAGRKSHGKSSLAEHIAVLNADAAGDESISMEDWESAVAGTMRHKIPGSQMRQLKELHLSGEYATSSSAKHFDNAIAGLEAMGLIQFDEKAKRHNVTPAGKIYAEGHIHGQGDGIHPLLR